MDFRSTGRSQTRGVDVLLELSEAGETPTALLHGPFRGAHVRLLESRVLDQPSCHAKLNWTQRRPGPEPSPGRRPYIARIECDQYMSPWGIAGAAGGFSSGMSVTSASVVRSSEAISAAFCRATRSTFVGSMMPACSM